MAVAPAGTIVIDGMKKNLVRTSKFLSLVLRHRPEAIGLELDEAGWAEVPELIRLAREQGRELTEPLIREVVETNDKRRFSLSADGSRIRARQGHSLRVDLGLEPVAPPEVLFHGTAKHFLDSILRRGLLKGERHHVHLSPDEGTARAVGQRHGQPIVLRIEAGRMHAESHAFFVSENGVWLTDHVPVEYFSVTP